MFQLSKIFQEGVVDPKSKAKPSALWLQTKENRGVLQGFYTNLNLKELWIWRPSKLKVLKNSVSVQ